MANGTKVRTMNGLVGTVVGEVVVGTFVWYAIVMESGIVRELLAVTLEVVS